MHQNHFDKNQNRLLHSIDLSLQEPLNQAILSLKKLLQQEKSTSAVYNELSKTLQNLTRMQHNLKNLTLLDSVTKHTYASQLQNVTTVDFLEDIARFWIKRADEKELFSFFYIDPTLPLHCDIDTYALKHILDELLDNAIKFTPKKGTISLDIRHNEVEGKHYLNCSITDSGVGIIEAKLAKLIQPVATPSNTGAGAGLASSFYLLQALGSPLNITSELGKGSRFSFKLPYKATNRTPSIATQSMHAAILQQNDTMAVYTRHLFSYLVATGIKPIPIEDIDDHQLETCQALFVISDTATDTIATQMQNKHPNCVLISALVGSKNQSIESNSSCELLFPLLPSKIAACFAHIQEKRSSSATLTHQDENRDISFKNLSKTSLAPTDLSHLKILLVEDNPINIKWTLMLLSRYDYDIDYAENGEVAVSMAKQKAYDLILMDIDMPIMNGIEATRLIKAYEKDSGQKSTPIVALTSHDQEGEREEILAQGLDEHLGKPLQLRELEELFKKYHQQSLLSDAETSHI